MTGCMKFNGWSAALGAPILRVTWHNVDENRTLKCIPIAAVNTGTRQRSGKQLCSLLEDIVQHNIIIGSEDIRIHTVTTDNEPATCLAVDLMTNYV